MMRSISSCDGQVWAVSEDGGLYYRANVSLGTPMGSNWFRLEEGHELGWRLVASRDGVMWGVDGKEEKYASEFMRLLSEIFSEDN